jgi:hypothetical protein
LLLDIKKDEEEFPLGEEENDLNFIRTVKSKLDQQRQSRDAAQGAASDNTASRSQVHGIYHRELFVHRP